MRVSGSSARLRRVGTAEYGEVHDDVSNGLVRVVVNQHRRGAKRDHRLNRGLGRQRNLQRGVLNSGCANGSPLQ